MNAFVEDIKQHVSATLSNAVDEIKKAGRSVTTQDAVERAVKDMNYALDAKVNQLARVTAQVRVTPLLLPRPSQFVPCRT
jgi:ribosome recycling factor